VYAHLHSFLNAFTPAHHASFTSICMINFLNFQVSAKPTHLPPQIRRSRAIKEPA
jgi:hypothetical protein